MAVVGGMIAAKSAFDTRLVKVGINLPSGLITFSDLAIFASGQKFGSAQQNQAEIRIYNLTKDQQNYILTQASPLLQPGKASITPINVTLDVGRQSYGTFRLFEGSVISTNITQPPDIGVVLQSLTDNVFLSDIKSVTQPAMSTVQTIAQQVATNLGLALNFQVSNNKQISNYSSSESVYYGIKDLNELGGIIATSDGTTLTVIDSNKTLPGGPIMIDETTGMVGIPQVTPIGCIVKVMVNSAIQIMSGVQVKSILNPAANGVYKVIKINFEIANRDQPFWYTLLCSNQQLFQGTQ